MADLEALRAGGWERVALPTEVAEYPTMLTHDERRLLHWLARDVWEGEAAIVDAGCFLGGSTISLITGLRARQTSPSPSAPVPPISTYDLFVAEGYEFASGYFDRWPEIRAGSRFRHAFDELLGPALEETTVHDGDITAERWDGGPIEILFLDVLKLIGINDHVLPEMLPHLIPGRSVLVQQDYVHGMLPWIHVTMELLEDALEHVADVYGCRVYAVVEEITRERVEEIVPLDERVEPARQRQLMQQAVWNAAGGARGSLTVAQANLLRAHGLLDAADALLDHVEREYADDPYVLLDVPQTRALVAERRAR